MRSLDDARESWERLKAYKSLRELKDAVRLEDNSSIATTGCRSACWKSFLLFDTIDTSTWARTLASTRSAYNSLRAHFLRHLEYSDELTAGHDPLSEETNSSPWAQFREDEELRGEILQDVVRCMPENLYFQQPDTQRMLTDILFVFCKLNPDVSYRQGMHELLAPILWVVERDAIDLGQTSKAMGEDAIVRTVFDAEHIEHDTFALFGQTMQSAKNFYEHTTTSGKENPMVARSRRIFNDLLPAVDDKLAQHLSGIDIVPQIFLIRWIRLLFGREFKFDPMLALWDVIFAEDPTLEIVDSICLAMLLRIHWDLIKADYNEALGLLLRYPEPEADFQPQTFALDGLYLQEHLDHHSGSYMVSKYTGRPLRQSGRPVTPPALQRNITTFSGANTEKAAQTNASPSPRRIGGPARNFEAVLQSTAKNIYSRGEKLGIGRAVRSAVDEVHKKAQEIRDTQTPSPPVAWRQRDPRAGASAITLRDRVKSLEDRSKQLAKLLEGAVNELWECQRLVTESNEGHGESEHLEQLSVAIAKAQFVQVYLDDPSLPLPQEDNDTAQSHPETTTDNPFEKAEDQAAEVPSEDIFNSITTIDAGATASVPLASQVIDVQTQDLADPADFEEPIESTTETKPKGDVPEITIHPETDKPSTSSDQIAQPLGREQLAPRPGIKQSSFSWMLDQQDDGSHRPASPARIKGFLFGDSAEESESGKEKGGSRKGSKERGKREEEGFDLSSLRHSKNK